jgi:hypothetical protein
MGVPKAPIHEDSDLLRSPREIGSSRQASVPPPTGQANLAQKLGHPDFRGLIAATCDALHQFSTL